MDKGKVVPYVECAYQALLGCKSPQGVKEWHKSQRRKLGEQKELGNKDYKSWVKGIKDKKVKQVSENIQVPLMLKLMKQAGMKQVTIEFIRKVFTEGAEYIDDVDISGLYPELPVEKQFGNYEYIEPPVSKKVWDVYQTVSTNEHVRVPDK